MRRWRLVAVLVGLVLLAATVGGWIAFAANYEPFVPNSAFWVVGNRVGDVGHRERGVDIDGFGRVEISRVTVTKGDRFVYTFGIENGGRFPVTIRSISPPLPDSGDGISSRVLSVMPDMWASSSPPFVRYDHAVPFTLHPGGEANVRILVRLDRCIFGRSTISWRGAAITFDVLGVRRHTFFWSSQQIEMTGDPCPRAAA